MEIKTVGRIVTREANGGDALIVGAILKSGLGIIKPYTVYEITSYEGVLHLSEKGESCGNPPLAPIPKDGFIFSWGWDVNQIISAANSMFVLTMNEMISYFKYKRGEEE